MAPPNHNSLCIQWKQIEEFALFETRIRKHPASLIRKLVHSLRTFGWMVPILIDEQSRVVAGEARLLAARELGWSQAPVIKIQHLSEAQIRTYRVADNRLAEESDWDTINLGAELIKIEMLGISIEDTGMEIAEFDIVTGTPVSSAADDAVEPHLRDEPPVSRPGDLFEIEDSLVFCGDALDPNSYDVLLEGEETVGLCLTDPPFNVAISGHVSGTGRHSEFVQASGEMSREEYRRFLATFLGLIEHCLWPGATVYVFQDWRSVAPLIVEVENAGLDMINLCVWAKTNAGMGSLYRSRHELIVVARKPGGKPINNVQLGRFGRNRTNVWEFAGANSIGSDAREMLRDHPTPKPVAMLSEAILDVTRRGDVVLDPFGGSGSTLIAAHRSGRVARVMELDPYYVDLIVRRAEAALGIKARCARTGRTFSELSAERVSTRKVRQRERGTPRNEGGAR